MLPQYDNKNLSQHDNKSITTLKEFEKDTIPCRIDIIKQILKGKKINSIINFDDPSTENFIGKCNDDNSRESYDTTVVLKKQLLDFPNVMSDIGSNLTYIKSGTTGHTFRGFTILNDNREIHYAVKIVAYPKKEKYGNITDICRPENAEIIMIKLLSYFIINKQTPHIILPLGTFNTDIKTFTNLIETDIVSKDNEKYKEFEERYKKGDYYDNVSVLISEWADHGDLLDFIRKQYTNFSPMHWKVIFFQIISVLSIIQLKYPSFRHNDLKANNILIQKISNNTNKHKYIISNTTYKIPNIGYIIKLWDFDFSCIPGLVDNEKVSSEWTKCINVTSEQNRYYDIHYFFNTLIKKGFFPQFLTDINIPQDAKNFVNRIVPPKYRNGKYIHKRGRILINKEFAIPNDILKHDIYFDEFRINNSNKIINNTSPNISKILLSENTNQLDIIDLLTNTNNKYIYKKKKKILYP